MSRLRPGADVRRFGEARRVRCYGGSIKMGLDDRGKGCFVCEPRRPGDPPPPAPSTVRFVMFEGPVLGDRFFIRLCDGCLERLATLHRAARAAG